jgi:hypothetical protein
VTPLLDAIAARARALGCEVEPFPTSDCGSWLRVSSSLRVHGPGADDTLSYFASGTRWANLSCDPSDIVARAQALAELHAKLTSVQP